MTQAHNNKKDVFRLKRQAKHGLPKKQNNNSNPKYLMSEPLKILPRLFTISTNNTSATFNTNILLYSSSVLKDYHQKNPDKLQYHFEVDDNKNVLSKIEKIFQGENICINYSEYPTYNLIKTNLNLFHLPSFPQFETVFFHNKFQSTKTIDIKYSLEELIRKEEFLTFTIKTNQNEYKCNTNGVILSSVIQELLAKDPIIDHFDYDFDDENGEFGFISDFFNFKPFSPNKKNVEMIKKIAEDLKIDSILDDINDIINPNTKLIELIDDLQETIDENQDIFELLYHIKEKTVISVADEIKKSQISKNEEKIYDLSAYIIQVVTTDISLHQYLIELLIELNKGENQGELKILLPFFVDRIMSLFYSKSANSQSYSLVFPFVYKMYKNGLISKEELYKNLNRCNFCNSFFISWFLPEIMEANPEKYKKELEPKLIKPKKKNDTKLSFMPFSKWKKKNDDQLLLIKPCNLEKLEEYKEMRDKCEDDDEIAKLIRNDDVDTFQSIVSRNGGHMSNVNVNMFETCIFKKPIRYLNYAAAYGSIKCFKYMILNGQQIDELTFSMAVVGGNSELIRIVDNKEAENPLKESKMYQKLNNSNKLIHISSIELALSQSIKRHKYELSDWILDEKIETLLSKNTNLNLLFIDSIDNANIYAFTKMIDNGLDFISYCSNFNQYIESASKNGFYSFLKYLMKLMTNYISLNSSIEIESIVNSCNIYIFRFFEADLNDEELCIALILSISAKFEKLTKELIETFISKKINIAPDNLIKLLNAAFTYYSGDSLFYLIEKANILSQFYSDLLVSLLNFKKECKYYIKIADIIYQNSPINDFSNALSKACNLRMTELVKHIISKNYLVNYSSFISRVNESMFEEQEKNKMRPKTSFSVDMFDLIMTSVDSDSQQILLYYINDAIKDKNVPLVQYLLDKNAPLENALILASSTSDLELVDIILKKNSQPSYINKKSCIGSALTIAAKNTNLEIVNRLLSIPGIDPNVLDNQNKTALIISAEKTNVEIFDALLTFYGNDIFNQKWQLEKAIITLFSHISNNQKPDDPKERNSDLHSINQKPFGLKERHSGLHSSSPNNKNNKAIILLKILDLNCIDPNFSFSNKNLLLFACDSEFVDVVKKLLQYDVIDVNVINQLTGNTPIFSAIINNNQEIFQLLAGHPKINMNHKNYKGQSVLTYAVLNNKKKFVEFILQNKNFNIDENEINHAFYDSKNYELSKLFVDFKSLDVNFIPINDYDSVFSKVNNKEFVQSSLMKAIKNKDDELFDLIIQHPSFKIIKSQLINSFILAFNFDSVSAFRKLIELFIQIYHDINAPAFNGNSLLVEAIIQKAKINIISLILNYPNFDSKKSDILKAFVLCCSVNAKTFFKNKDKSILNRSSKSENTMELLDLLYQYDFDHDKLIYDKINENGSTILSQVFTKLLKSNSPNSIEQVKDAIKNDSYISFISIIKSTGCDLSQKIQKSVKTSSFEPMFNQTKEENYTTLIHLAASLGREKILNEIVTKHLIDVNTKNSDGKTALMEACQNKKIESVKILFKADDLDFRYRDKDGKDAIDILREAKKIRSKSSEIIDKYEYLSELLNLMNIGKGISNPTKKTFESKKSENDRKPFSFESKKLENDRKAFSFESKKLENNRKAFSFISKHRSETSKEKPSDVELKPDISIEYGPIKFNDQSPSSSKNTKMKLEFYNESFTEKPKLSLQNQVSCLEPEIRTRRRIRDEMFSDEEENFMNQRMQPNFAVDQNQMILLQQQQQKWFQMIQMNNSMQAQISIQMMNQVNLSQNQTKKKKRSKK